MIGLEEVKAKFPKELLKLLVFEEFPDLIVVNRKAFLDTKDFAAVSRIVEELEGEYKSNGKLSHWKIPKKQKDPEVLEDPHVKMDRAIKNIVAAWRELNPE